ncbi:MAG: carbohydrate ABC transporter permease [Bifidobacteriaceae bacterium]|jgi:multiple sugar transport system permease protein|nr:carbohydrate ABC transporter permease [Bifidobacteriaceae bacterium]
MKPRRRLRIFSTAGLVVGLIAGAVFAGAPALWMLSNSFKPNTDIFQYPPRLISHFTIDAYASIISNPEKVRFFVNSYVVSSAVVVLTLVAGIMAGYAFSRFDFPLKKALNSVIISVQAVPPITLLIPYFSLIVALGIFNTYFALIFTYMVITVPYAILMMTGYFNTIPRELDEAIKIDGGGSFRALWQVLVPVAGPGIVSVGTYTFMVAWNEFLFALTLTEDREMRTVPVGIQLLMGQHSYEWNEMMAMSVLGCLPILILFLIFQRQFIGGMTEGSVKN